MPRLRFLRRFGRGREGTRSLALAPVTAGAYLAARASLGTQTPDDTADLASLSDDVLTAFVDTVTETTEPVTYADRAALLAVATAVYGAWRGVVDAHRDRGLASAEVWSTAANWWPEAGRRVGVDVPEDMMGSDRWHTLRALPLWEAVASSRIASASAAMEKAAQKLRATLPEQNN